MIERTETKQHPLLRLRIHISTLLSKALSGSEPAKQPESHQIMTRRQFAQRLGGGGLAAAVELKTGAIGKMLDFVIGTWHEGSIAQRAIKLEQLMVRLHNEPTLANRELLAHWLKFNVAQIEATRRGFSITASFLEHYLYGRGESKDISQPILDKVFLKMRQDSEGYPVNARDPRVHSILKKTTPTHEEKLIVYAEYVSSFSSTLNFSKLKTTLQNPTTIVTDHPFVVESHTKIDYEQHKKLGTTFPIKGRFLLPSFGTDDLHTALGRYWLHFEGNATLKELPDSEKDIIGEEDWKLKPLLHHIEMTNVTLTLSDLYDFDRNTVTHGYDVFASDALRAFLSTLLGKDKAEKYLENLDFETYEYLRNTHLLTLDQHISGQALADTGFAKTFNVEATFHLPQLIILTNMITPEFKTNKLLK